MNIVYISCGTSNPWAGPTFSIPNQIEAQKRFDNVFWYDLSYSANLIYQENVSMWKQTGVYHDLLEYPDCKISSLPTPFCKPDLVIFEQFYIFAKFRIIRDKNLKKIPYIIIPRGELTGYAQKKSQIKKCIANMLICKKFAKNAVAIHYLTEQEKKDSGNCWNANTIVIPNGVSGHAVPKMEFNGDEINVVSIGRIEKYQKGLDLMLGAIATIKQELLNGGVKFRIYGPDNDGQLDELSKCVSKFEIEELVTFYGPVFGEDKQKVLQNSDVFIMTSRFEGHPTALIEALSYGLPCLVTEGSNMREEIKQCDAGWTADTSIDSIAYALLQMMKEKEKIQTKQKNAVKLAKKYEWTTLAQKSHNEYMKLVKRI